MYPELEFMERDVVIPENVNSRADEVFDEVLNQQEDNGDGVAKTEKPKTEESTPAQDNDNSNNNNSQSNDKPNTDEASNLDTNNNSD